jgi:hypothetical protein
MPRTFFLRICRTPKYTRSREPAPKVSEVQREWIMLTLESVFERLSKPVVIMRARY